MKQPDGSTLQRVDPRLWLRQGQAAQVALQVAKACACMAKQVCEG